MDRTEATVRYMLKAIEAPLYEIGVLSDQGMSCDASRALRRLSAQLSMEAQTQQGRPRKDGLRLLRTAAKRSLRSGYFINGQRWVL